MIIYKFFKNWILNVRYSRILKKVYDEENVLQNLSQLFDGANFKIDRIGRVYAILNPNIKNGKYDPDSQIFEYGDEGLNNDTYVEKWIMERLNVASQFIRANNLFELLTYTIERKDNYGNYLFIFKPITLEDHLKSTRNFLILLLSIAVAAAVILPILL